METNGISFILKDFYSGLIYDLKKMKLSDGIFTRSGYREPRDIDPLTDIYYIGEKMVTYGYLTPQKVKRITAENFVKGKIVKKLRVFSI